MAECGYPPANGSIINRCTQGVEVPKSAKSPAGVYILASVRTALPSFLPDLDGRRPPGAKPSLA